LTAFVGNVTNDLQLTCEELNRRGCSARIREFRYCGERETRLIAREPGGRVVVELLGPSEDTPGDCWHAARVVRGRRVVWCGPVRADVVSGLDLVPFVADLLIERESVLAGKYRRCDGEP
jgi:hypothetical protein